MRGLFLEVLNASVQGGVLIAVVLLLRLVLKKAPRNSICLLWLLAGLRLLMPFEISSPLSLQPRVEPVTESQWVDLENDGKVLEENEWIDIPESSMPAQNTPDYVEGTAPQATEGRVEAERKVNWFAQIPYLWLAVAVGLAVYGLASYLRLKRRVQDGVIFAEGIWVCSKLDTAFVLGFLRPQIYLPAGLSEEEHQFVLAHERAHIARCDHWWKLLGFAAVALHWFNPLVWLAYSLLCKDMEMACDERVVRNMDTAQRKAYSMAMVACAAQRRVISACPVAFGEVGVKGRVKAVLNYKKPGFWIILIAVVAVIAVAVCFMTSPMMTDEEVLDNFYAEMEELQNRENIHLLVTEEIETDNPYLQDRQQEYWISGDDWYGVYTYIFTHGRYEICVAQVDGVQVCCKRSDDFEVVDNGIWQEVSESNYHHMTQLMTTDWTEATVKEIRRESGGYKVIVEGYHANERQYTTFENYYTFQMDHNGELVGVTRYDCSETIHKVFDLSGWFQTATTYTYTFLEADNAAFGELVNQAFGLTCQE